MEKKEISGKIIDVVCAIIELEGRILATQRSEKMKLPLKWEFPGGKVEDDEDETACLEREIKEELNLKIEIGIRLDPVYHDSADMRIRLIPYLAKIRKGDIRLSEHAQLCWLEKEQLTELDWAEADRQIALNLLAHFSIVE